jgi:hypothetical protein
MRNKTKNKMNKLLSFVALVGIIFLAYHYFFYRKEQPNKIIDDLKRENQFLREENEKWEVWNDSVTLVIQRDKQVIEQLKYRDSLLVDRIEDISYQVTALKANYEKASKSSAHFNSDSLQVYFSKL